MTQRKRGELGTMLRGARLGLFLSQREAAQAVGVSCGHLAQLETGTIRRPALEVLAKLAKFHGLLLADLARAAGYDALPLDEAAIRASERDRIASLVRSLNPLTFLRSHNLEPGAGAGAVLCALAEEIDGSGVCGKHAGRAEELSEGSGDHA